MSVFQPNPGDEQGIESLFVGRRRELETLRATLMEAQQRVAIIQGLRGSGKTALLMMFHRQAHHLFPSGYESTYGFGPVSPVAVARNRLRLPLEDRALLAIDDAHIMTPEAQAELAQFLPENPKLRLLLATSEPLPLNLGPAETIHLPGLS